MRWIFLVFITLQFTNLSFAQHQKFCEGDIVRYYNDWHKKWDSGVYVTYDATTQKHKVKATIGGGFTETVADDKINIADGHIACLADNSALMPYNVNKDPKSEVAQIIGTSHKNNEFTLAWKNHSTANNDIQVVTYKENGGQYQKQSGGLSIPNLGDLTGFTMDAAGNKYVLTNETTKMCGDMFLYRNNKIIWDGDEERSHTVDKNHEHNCPQNENILHPQKGRIVHGSGKIFVAYQGGSWPWEVVVNDNISGTSPQKTKAKCTLLHHSWGMRTLFDGNDFVVAEERDHDMGLTMMKIKPETTYNADADRVRPVYTHTNFGNSFFAELGAISKGHNDVTDGYLMLFAGERDWDYIFDKFTALQAQGANPFHKANDDAGPYLYADPGDMGGVYNPFTPRDLAIVHVKKDFDTGKANWKEWAATDVDNSAVVNSEGQSKNITFKSRNDGWNWNTYNCCGERNAILNGREKRRHQQAGINWLTTYGDTYETGTNTAPSTLPTKSSIFTHATRPKMVKTSSNTYLVLWEERSNAKQGSWAMGTYSTTKAMKISLSKSNDKIKITKGSIKDIGKIRLHHQDDAFVLDNKIAWVTSNAVSTKMVLHTVDENLIYQPFELEL